MLILPTNATAAAASASETRRRRREHYWYSLSTNPDPPRADQGRYGRLDFAGLGTESSAAMESPLCAIDNLVCSGKIAREIWTVHPGELTNGL